MSNESYVTMKNPGIEVWLEYNKDFFSALKGSTPEGVPRYAPFTDVDLRAAEEGVDVKEYFDRVSERVGSLGRATLRLVHSAMDNAWHITVEPVRDTQDS